MFKYDEFTLRPYQEDARDKMVDRGKVLVAMTMGAGKTPTTLAATEELYEQNEIDRVLVICPSGLKYQWLKEVKKFTNAKALVIDGDTRTRSMLWKHAGRYRYVIVNPEIVSNDAKALAAHRWDCLVIDESTSIKNPKAKRTKLIKKLSKSMYFRFALTGQPVENKPEELFSIMECVDPGVLGKPDLFDSTFVERDGWGKPIRYRNLDLLHEDLKDCMVRYSRADIAEYLPRVMSSTIPVTLDRKTARLYMSVAQECAEEIKAAMSQFGGRFDVYNHYSGEPGEAAEVRGSIMAKLTVLRMLCDHPHLVVESAITYRGELERKPGVKPKNGSKYAAELYEAGLLDGLDESPKMDEALNRISMILQEDPRNKVVLFSFFKDSLKLIAKEISRRAISEVAIFTGDQNASQKDAAKTRFQKDPKCRVFLSSDAGGYGVDLPNANHLTSFDLPWSAGKLDQRESRIIRTSSEFNKVHVTTMVIRGSIEERQGDMIEQKQEIGEAFLDGGYDSQGDLVLELGSLSDFLLSSAV